MLLQNALDRLAEIGADVIPNCSVDRDVAARGGKQRTGNLAQSLAPLKSTALLLVSRAS